MLLWPSASWANRSGYPARELIALYVRRWGIELCLRHLKTTMGMDQLRCKTPDMAEKELLGYLVAHNLIRCVMAEAVARYPVVSPITSKPASWGRIKTGHSEVVNSYQVS